MSTGSAFFGSQLFFTERLASLFHKHDKVTHGCVVSAATIWHVMYAVLLLWASTQKSVCPLCQGGTCRGCAALSSKSHGNLHHASPCHAAQQAAKVDVASKWHLLCRTLAYAVDFSIMPPIITAL